jgi:hypothetical protein
MLQEMAGNESKRCRRRLAMKICTVYRRRRGMEISGPEKIK